MQVFFPKRYNNSYYAFPTRGIIMKRLNAGCGAPDQHPFLRLLNAHIHQPILRVIHASHADPFTYAIRIIHSSVSIVGTLPLYMVIWKVSTLGARQAALLLRR
jgi:hypothetical protein